MDVADWCAIRISLLTSTRVMGSGTSSILPSGKHTKTYGIIPRNYGKSAKIMENHQFYWVNHGKSTISMAIFTIAVTLDLTNSLATFLVRSSGQRSSASLSLRMTFGCPETIALPLVNSPGSVARWKDRKFQDSLKDKLDSSLNNLKFKYSNYIYIYMYI